MNFCNKKIVKLFLGGLAMYAAATGVVQAKTEEGRHLSKNNVPKSSKSSSIKTTGRPITIKEMLNCICVIPALFSDPDSSQQMKDGKYKIEDESLKNSMHGCEEGDLGSPTSGIMNGKQMGAAYLMWNTGGTQWWTSFILFERVKGKVVGNRHVSIGYPFNHGQVVNLRLADNKLFFDVKGGPPEFRPANYENMPEIDSNPSMVPIEPQQIMNLNVCVPDEGTLTDQDGLTKVIRLKNGVYSSKRLTCRIKKVSKVKIRGELATLATATISYKGRVPLQGVFKFQRRKGQPFCEGFYSACNHYVIGDITARIEDKPFSEFNGEVVTDVKDGRFNFSDFRKADYK